jgi:hypothetical protein
MGTYEIREDGPNGSVDVEPDKIVRRYKKRLGRDRELKIAMRDVSSVHVDHRIGTNAVVLKAHDTEYTWKIAGDGNAKRLVDEIKGYGG